MVELVPEVKLTASDNKTYIQVIPERCMISGFGNSSRPEWNVLYRATKTGNYQRWGCPLMFPNFSFVKDGKFNECGTELPKHGLVTYKEWKEIKRTPTSVTVALDESEDTLKVFPFKFHLEVTWEVKPNTCVHRWVIKNTGDKTMPCSPGIHPYFSVPQGVKREVKLTNSEFKCDAYDWEDGNPDDNVPFTGNMTVDIPTLGQLVIREVSEPKLFPRMQVWSEKSSAPDHDFICFEPVRAGGDGLNHADRRLNIAPGQQVEVIHEFEAKF